MRPSAFDKSSDKSSRECSLSHSSAVGEVNGVLRRTSSQSTAREGIEEASEGFRDPVAA